MRQTVVDREMCARVGTGEAGTSGYGRSRPSTAANSPTRRSVRAALTEAVIGAAWLDLGPAVTGDAVRAAFADAISCGGAGPARSQDDPAGAGCPQGPGGAL